MTVPWSRLLVWLDASVARIARPSEPADLLGRVEEARGQPGVVALDAASAQQGDRHERQADPDAHREEASQEVAEIAAVDRQLGQHGEPGRRESDPDDRDVPDAEALVNCWATPAPITIPAVTGRKASPARSGL